MRYEYKAFLLPAAMYQAEPLRVQMTEWLNGIGADGWEVFLIASQKDNPAGLIAWAKRAVVDPECFAGMDDSFKKFDEGFSAADRSFSRVFRSGFFGRMFK